MKLSGQAIVPYAAEYLDQVFFTGQRLAPTSADIVVRLGRDSAAFNASLRRLGDLYDAVAMDPSVQTKFREWNVLLAKVYGSALGDRTLFLKHTYLVMVSRAVVGATLAPTQLGTVKQFRGLVDGDFFRALGIGNLAEPDFFSWALGTPSEAGFCDFLHQLLGCLSVYDFAKLEEDILKELYQGLVDPESRHDLGEYYTPDWLAELTLEQIQYRGGKLLDPSCGSGGFLFAAVQRLRAAGFKGAQLVKAVVESVVGIDVHPVAVLMAKANLLLALADDRAGYGDFISLPVYMADTLMTDEDAKQGVLRVKVSDTEMFNLPKVDYIVGNPPWLSLRYVKDRGYKQRIKELTFQHGLLAKTEVKLFTQMDTSTLFFNHCAHEFLKPGGTIAFLLPKTVILPAKQHARFQEQGFSQVHDFTEVAPLFNVRACLVVRGPTPLKTRIPRTKWAAKLAHRNLNLADARRSLAAQRDEFSFLASAEPRSPYFAHFLNGANLYPRCPIFVSPAVDKPLIADAPFLETSKAALKDSKPNWRLRLSGQVEKELLFGTVLAKDLIPFVVRKLSLVVLPVKETSHHDLRMLSSTALLDEGWQNAHDWFQQAERLWEERRKDESMTLQETLDFNGKLTQQRLRAKTIVLYNKSGTNLAAAMLTPKEARKIGPWPIRGFIADNVCYRYGAASEDEALYLVGVLNTTVVNQAIKPYQPEGLLGERDIHRRPFEACAIPLFDAQDKLHHRIAEAAGEARAELFVVVPRMQTPVATARADARRLVAHHLHKLDELVAELLDGQPLRYPAPKSGPAKLLELFDEKAQVIPLEPSGSRDQPVEDGFGGEVLQPETLAGGGGPVVQFLAINQVDGPNALHPLFHGLTQLIFRVRQASHGG